MPLQPPLAVELRLAVPNQIDHGLPWPGPARGASRPPGQRRAHRRSCGDAEDGMTRALVLSCGGPVGVAWQSGLLAGFAQGGVDLAVADYVLGTSAGAVVGAR